MCSILLHGPEEYIFPFICLEDEFDYQEDFEAKLIENIEGARQKK